MPLQQLLRQRSVVAISERLTPMWITRMMTASTTLGRSKRLFSIYLFLKKPVGQTGFLFAHDISISARFSVKRQ